MANLENIKSKLGELKIPTMTPLADGLSAGVCNVDEFGSGSTSMQEAIRKAILTAPTQSLADADLTTPADEEWIWIDGYKATNNDMKCMDYQYELGKQFDMPDGSKIEDCHSGFHLCLKLKDVFNYYRIGDGHRFFKVSALVRKKDFEEYGKGETPRPGYFTFFYGSIRDKLAAKSIIFTKELTHDEIFKDTKWADKDAEFKSIALSESPCKAETHWMIKGLVKLGYSEPLAKKILDNDDHSEESVYNLAMALETQPGLNIDTKIIALLAY
jgi:hypothetical protein